jgi:hypothetical protein
MMTFLFSVVCFGVGFWLGMKAGVWGTINVLADAPPAKRMAVFAKWIAKRKMQQ